ncbi:MAG TPA: hypothetical protein IAC18_06975 [Candidatus Scatomorpha merdipullorum]|uniref:Uncharacterized protein n=1 Tax=Candidatus Scatomorpha merdipullorum TaxID=2840927 RepID=A0A9D1FFB2_9FIRM|nr:hypothetical protein [Candidatus Scatomorpha merdipullorum]
MRYRLSESHSPAAPPASRRSGRSASLMRREIRRPEKLPTDAMRRAALSPYS